MHVTSKDYYSSLAPLLQQVSLVIGHAGSVLIRPLV